MLRQQDTPEGLRLPSFLTEVWDTPPASTPSTAGPPDWPAQVGPYRIEGPLGRGGMGLVLRGQEETVRWTLESNDVEAPVAQGDTVGSIVVFENDAEVLRVPALAAEAVQRRPWWRFWGG